MLTKKTNLKSSEKRGYVVAAGVIWISLCGVSAKAQTGPTERRTKPTWRLITIEEGRSIVGAAWAEEQPATGTQDCSHWVRAVYRKAGFEYPYDSSFELYEGNENFIRVRFPHSGDLIVWPGHVGIVEDPSLHSFYSLVKTGLEEQNYEGTYWKSRGKPRFYRYRVQNERVLDVAKVRADSNGEKSGKKLDETGFSLKNSSSSLFASEDNADLTITPKSASRRNSVAFGPQAPAESAGRAATFQIPSSIIIGPGSRPPTREEVAEGISELNDSAGHVLRTDEPLKARLPVVIVEQFTVERVDIKRDHGWAPVMVNSKVSINNGTTQMDPRKEEVRWELRRTDSGWEVLAPPGKTYIASDVVVKNLAAQLARPTDSDHTTAYQESVRQQESSLANLLGVLLDSH